MPRGGARLGAGRKRKQTGQESSALNSVESTAKSVGLVPEVVAPRSSGRLSGLRPWQPGQSGNPSGRPKGERRYLVERYGDDAKVLHEQMDKLLRHRKTPAQVKNDILKFKIERHSGKAPQTMEHTGEGGGPVELRIRVVPCGA